MCGCVAIPLLVPGRGQQSSRGCRRPRSPSASISHGGADWVAGMWALGHEGIAGSLLSAPGNARANARIVPAISVRILQKFLMREVDGFVKSRHLRVRSPQDPQGLRPTNAVRRGKLSQAWKPRRASATLPPCTNTRTPTPAAITAGSQRNLGHRPPRCSPHCLNPTRPPAPRPHLPPPVHHLGSRHPRRASHPPPFGARHHASAREAHHRPRPTCQRARGRVSAQGRVDAWCK
jgi:hypothetical protein